METFGERLKHLIKHSEIKTLKAFAEKAGVHENSINRIAGGKNNPSYDVILACIDIFPAADLKWLLTGETNEREHLSKDLESEIEKRVEREVKLKLKSALSKYFSNRINPQQSILFDTFQKERVSA